MSWSDDIRCLYCDGRLPLYRKITHGQFCSGAHRKAYWRDQEKLAVERLNQTHDSLQAYRELLPIDIATAHHSEVVQRLSSPVMPYVPAPEDWREKADPPLGPYFRTVLRKVPAAHKLMLPSSLSELTFEEYSVEIIAARDVWSYVSNGCSLAPLVPATIAEPAPARMAGWTPSPGYTLEPAPMAPPAELALVGSLKVPEPLQPVPVRSEAPARSEKPVRTKARARSGAPIKVEAPAHVEAPVHVEPPAAVEPPKPVLVQQPVDPPFAGRLPMLAVSPRQGDWTTVWTERGALPEFPKRGFFPLSGIEPATRIANAGTVEMVFHRPGVQSGAATPIQPVLEAASESPRPPQIREHKAPAAANKFAPRVASAVDPHLEEPAPVAPSASQRSILASELAATNPPALPVASLEPITDFEALTIPPTAQALPLDFIGSIEPRDHVVAASMTGALSTLYTLPHPVRMEPVIPKSRLEILDEKPVSDNFESAPAMPLGGTDPMARMAGLLRFAHPQAQMASWSNVADFWKKAPRDLRLLLIAIPALIALVFHPTPKLSIRVPQSNPVAGIIGAQIRNVRQSLVDRAAIALDEDFRSGLDSWSSRENHQAAWAFDATGFVQPGPLALYQPSMNLSDYQMQFLGMIDQKALSWVVRAQDFDNYYVVKLVVIKPGPLPEIGVTRYAVINGKAQDRADRVVPISARQDTIYRVRLEASGEDFLLEVQGETVDSWKESRLRRGGIGFFSARGEQSRVRWVQVTHQYDMLGRLCAYLAPYNIPSNGSW